MAKNKSTTHIDKLGTVDTFRAPWESEAGGDADVDKPTLKRLVFNLKKDLAIARDSLDDAKADLAEAETELEEAKTQAADGSGAESQKKIDSLQTQLDEVTAERDEMVASKELADLRSEVLGDFERENPRAAKYVVGTTQEELEESLKQVREDFGISEGSDDDGDDGDDDDDDAKELERVARTAPRARNLLNPTDGQNGRGGEPAIDFDKVAQDSISGGRVFG